MEPVAARSCCLMARRRQAANEMDLILFPVEALEEAQGGMKMRDGSIFFDIQPGDDMLHSSKRDFLYLFIFLKLFAKTFVLISMHLDIYDI